MHLVDFLGHTWRLSFTGFLKVQDNPFGHKKSPIVDQSPLEKGGKFSAVTKKTVDPPLIEFVRQAGTPFMSIEILPNSATNM